jgi:hypothetical protein
MFDHHPGRRRARVAATLVAAVALTGASASLAVAEITLSDDKRGDALCDEPPCPDLKSAIGDHAPLDETTQFHIITQHNPIQAARTPRIAIDARGSSAPDYYVAKKRRRTGVYDATTGERVGPADLRSASATGMSWSFRPSTIGNPTSYRWQVQIVDRGGSRIDSAPNKGYVTERLG